MYLVMVTGLNGKNEPVGLFSSLKKAKAHVPKMHYEGPIWIEKFKVDNPGFYELEDEFIVWKSKDSSS